LKNVNPQAAISVKLVAESGQWSDDEYDLQAVKEELADVMVYCRNMLDSLGLDEDEIINSKMDQNEKKYPVEKARGRADKYTKL
ncbi:MAG: nucleotide pyrophosphohydrolase, partial [Clostridia bacterium]|nr:nucleotide pyrophosphohydrolase [Clostridia bacterium]